MPVTFLMRDYTINIGGTRHKITEVQKWYLFWMNGCNYPRSHLKDSSNGVEGLLAIKLVREVPGKYKHKDAVLLELTPVGIAVNTALQKVSPNTKT